MPLALVTAPSAMLIDMAEARLHVRQDLREEDPRIRRAILACTRWAEGETQRSFIACRWKLTLDAFPGNNAAAVPYGVGYGLPGNGILLERGPTLSVVSINYTAMDGTLTLLPVTEYQADVSGAIARITPKFGKIWPVTLPQIGAVEVVYDAGVAAAFTADATADTLTVPGIWKTYAVGDAVRLTNSGGALPAPLVELTDYYVQAIPSAGVYKLAATSGGAAIDLVDIGTGTHYFGVVPSNVISWLLLRLGSMYEHREADIAMDRGSITAMPYVDRLLDAHTSYLY